MSANEPEASDSLQVEVTTLDGSTLSVSVPSGATARDLKVRLEEVAGVPLTAQTLLLDSRIPEDQEVLVATAGGSLEVMLCKQQPFDRYFDPEEQRLVPDVMGSVLASDGSAQITWVFDKELGAHAAVLDGTFLTMVSPSVFPGRHAEESWVFWINAQVGRSGSWYHRFLNITVSESHTDGALWMDFFGQTRELAVMDSSHSMSNTGAKTTTKMEEGIWYHYAITFGEDGETKVYLNGGLEATTTMEPPSQRAYSRLSFGNTDRSGGGSGSGYGFIGRVADVRHYAAALSGEAIADLCRRGLKAP